MRAMVFEEPGQPLTERELPEPSPADGQVLIDVSMCGVCRTDLHIFDGELDEPKLPLILGHQIVGRVRESGASADRFATGDRVGVPWLGWTDGTCRYCRTGRENLCEHAKFTGYDIDGGYAERAVADERFCFPIPDGFPDDHAAPLLCAGLIGYRSLRLAGEGERLGLLRLRRPPPTSSARSPSPEVGASSPSPARATPRRRSWPARWGRSGPALWAIPPHRISTPPSSSLRSGSS